MAGLEMRLWDLVHLRLHLYGILMTMLGGQQAIVSIPQGGIPQVVLQGRKHFVTQQFIEALSYWSEGLEVGIVERTHGRMGEHLAVGVAEDQVDGVGHRAV